MSELVEFIRGRLDADEQTARAAVEVSDRFWRLNFDSQGDWISDFDNGTPLVCGYAANEDAWGKGRDSDVLAHIARHDPARVLAEVDAKRAILDLHTGPQYGRDDAHLCMDTMTDDDECETVRALAQPYAGEPGWRDEWGTQ